MAQLIRLPSPNIAGTLPSFYTNMNGTTNLVVPFTMNSSVAVSEVAGFALRIKTTTTDTLVAIEQKEFWDSENMTVSFALSDDTVNKLVEGNFYKVQLAYYNKNVDGVPYIGYYSTASIIKYTIEPYVTIQSLDAQIVNSINNRSFIGLYQNEDISEKVYQYRFILYGIMDTATGSSTEMITDTDWCIHDSSQDSELGKSTDQFVLQETMESGRSYLIKYFIRTTNGLEMSSPMYSIVSVVNAGTILPFHINHELDYDNGRIIVTVQSNSYINPATNTKANQLNEISKIEHPEEWKFAGAYQLLRTDSNSNYNNWIVIKAFSSIDFFDTWSYIDYTVESGVSYKYGIEKISQQVVRSRRVISANPITAFFEHMFLYDGSHQLKIAFNANVTSFKEIISEAKKTTLGRKYPVIMRNGILKYKEFQINGLLSYLLDPDELFIDKSDLISSDTLKTQYAMDFPQATRKVAIMPNGTDNTDANISIERNFCLEVLSWLNNGKIKLFRSPNEGNYIVKLTNISLSPEPTTNRMLHTFQATASEVADFTFDKLIEFEIVEENLERALWYEATMTIYLHQQRESMWANKISIESFLNEMAEKDWLDGKICKSISITVPSDERHKDAIIKGEQFSWGEYSWAIGPENSYSITLEEGYEAPLKFIFTTQQQAESFAGDLTITYLKTVSTEDAATDSRKVLTWYGWSEYAEDNLYSNSYNQNMLYELSTLKRSVINQYAMEIHTLPIIEQNNISVSWWNNQENAATVQKYIYLYDKWAIYKNGSHYYRYDGNTLTEIQNYDTSIQVRDQSNPLYQIPIDITVQQAGMSLPEIDYSDSQDVFLKLSNGIYANLYYQVEEPTYAIESTPNVIQDATSHNEAYRNWCMYAYNLEQINLSEARTLGNSPVLIWKNQKFIPISQRDLTNPEYINYDFYKVRSTPYSAEIIKDYRNRYRNSLNALNTKLIENL